MKNESGPAPGRIVQSGALDSHLIQQIAEGDERAFATLYQQFAPALRGTAYRIVQDSKEAEDVLQEGLTYIWRKAAAFDPSKSNPLSWALMIVRNKAIDRLRLHQRVETFRKKLIAESELFPKYDDSALLMPLLRERSAFVRLALENLSREQREALELAFFEGFTHEQIAINLKTPLGTIKARIRRGLRRLRYLLRENPDTDQCFQDENLPLGKSARRVHPVLKATNSKSTSDKNPGVPRLLPLA